MYAWYERIHVCMYVYTVSGVLSAPLPSLAQEDPKNEVIIYIFSWYERIVCKSSYAISQEISYILIINMYVRLLV